MNVINEEIPEDSTVDDSPLDEFRIQNAQFEEEMEDLVPLGNNFSY